MLGLFNVQVALAAVSGILLAVLGIALLAMRARRSHTVAFAAFTILWGGQIVFGNLSRLSSLSGDEAAARRWILYSLAMFVCVYVPLAYFAALYPVRHGAFARRPGAAALLILPAAVGALSLLLAPELLHRGFTGASDQSRSAWGPLFPLYALLFYAAFYYALSTLHDHQRRATSTLEARRALYVMAALALFVGYTSVENLILFGAPLLVGPAADIAGAWQGIVFALVAIAGVALHARVARDLLRDRRPHIRLDARFVLAAFALPVLFGAISGLSKLHAIVFTAPLDTLGVWRTLSAALIAYAILRFELFDIDVKVKRGAIAVSLFAGAAIGAIVVEQLFERIVGSTGLAITLTQVALVGAVALALTRTPSASAWLAARVLPGVDAPQKLDARRLEVYEAALTQAHASAGGIDAQHVFLADLRARLGISEAEHQLLARLVSAPPTGARASGGTAEVIEPGARLADRYRVERLLGTGSYARAFLALDETLGRRVVLKVVHAYRARSDEAARAFLREARLAASLDHPNVIRVYDFGYAADAPYITMEYADGGSLQDLLQRQGALGQTEARRILGGVLTGVAHVHAHGILHRDLKPANVFLTSSGQAKVADFGLALGEDVDATQSGLDGPGFAGGTPAYMSPEAVRGLPPTPASDVYSLGAMLYQMLTGQTYLPFEGRTAFEIRRQILESEPRLDAAPEPLRGVIARALAKEPEQRFASAQDMLHSLAAPLPAGVVSSP